MKITLIYPGISWSGFNTFGKSNNSESNFINHGLATLAAYITKNKHNVDYVDLRMLTDWKEFRKRIKESDSTVFGISSTTVDFGNTIKISKIIKRIKPRSVVVVGGVHPTIRPREATVVKAIDYVVTGEGEIVLNELLNLLSMGKKPKNKLIIGRPCTLEEIPHIDRDLFKHAEGEMIYPFVDELESPSATIMSSRGCPFNCNFCQPAERMIFGGKVRLRNLNDVISELKEIKEKYGLKSFMIHDDLFIISRDRIMEFVRLYKAAGIKAKFICQGRADLIIKFEKEIKELKKIGLVGIMIGFESGSDRILKFLNKQTTVAQNYQAAKILKSLRVKIWANYMLGIPSETYLEMLQTCWMVSRIKPEYLSPSLFTPYPETGLYDYCQKNNLLIFDRYEQYRRSLGGDKIKGINYRFVRLLIFIFYPWNSKVDTVRFVFKSFWRKYGLAYIDQK